MKTKIISAMLIVIFMVGSMSIIGCGNNGDNGSSVQKSHDHVKYQCPMNCEEGKTYENEGNCPVCGMELKEV